MLEEFSYVGDQELRCIVQAGKIATHILSQWGIACRIPVRLSFKSNPENCTCIRERADVRDLRIFS
jgi:hypothetical protein